MIFKGGSGSGVNLSALRSCREKLSAGGTASGPLSFMKAADASAGVIKSGGKTRRAAKMVVLNADHPDIEDFIKCKVEEEKKAWALIEAGYDSSLDGAAYGSVFFQNANNSVRATDDFMEAVVNDGNWRTRFVTSGEVAEEQRAREILHDDRRGGVGLRRSRDAVRYHDQCLAHLPQLSGRINASNPCSEYMHLDNSACNLASLNLLTFLDDRGEFDVKAFRHAVDVMITAQDILVDNSSYPTEEIGRNAHAFRELGLGYANLGATLMALGMPYDSDQGRSYCRRDHRPDDRRGLSAIGARGRGDGPVRGLCAQSRADAARDRAPSRMRLQARKRLRAAGSAARGALRRGTTRSSSGSARAIAIRRRR